MAYYIYPTYNPKRDKSGNLYIKYFRESFEHSDRVVNRMNSLGISSVLFNLDANIFIFHWVDLIPYKRLGLIQTLFFIFSLNIIQLKKKKIVWVLHNKMSHKGFNPLVERLMRIMSKSANVVITHSSEGVLFYNNEFIKPKNQVISHIPHPIYSQDLLINPKVKIEWDYIIWGGIGPYKRVFEFLSYVKGQVFFKDKKILICGKCSDIDYLNKIKSVLNSNITFINEFVPEEQLRSYILASQCILFTYGSETVLSSGALIYSLNFNKRIIAPRVGNFMDLGKVVDCFDEFSEIEFIDITKAPDTNILCDYLLSNKWENLSDKIKALLS